MSHPEIPTTHHHIGHYRVLRQLGEGGMGVVYEAVRDDIGIRAAVKVLRPEFARNMEISTRFFNEARAANMIQHPGIVKVFDYGHLPTGEAYLAMELLEGESLRQRLEQRSRLNEADSMRIARQIAAALASAHAKNIVHRDLKPENVMLIPDAETPDGERIKILDFGIAKLDPTAQGLVRTRTNSMMGTPVYMAPEQCRGVKNIDDRADVYALGVMIFEMLTGQPPFYADYPGDIIGMHMFKVPPQLSASMPDVDPQLSEMVNAILSKEPTSRPSMADIAMLLKQLGHFVSSVLPARPSSIPELSQSQSARLKIPQDSLRMPAQKPVTAINATDAEDTKALSPTVKAAVLPPSKTPQAAGRQASNDEDALQSIRIAPKSVASFPSEILTKGAPASARPGSATGGRPDDATEVLIAEDMPTIGSGRSDIETIPVMNRAAVANAQLEYLRAKTKKLEPRGAPRVSSEQITAPPGIRSFGERLTVEFQTRWDIPEQRMGILVFGGLVVLGGILGILILALGGS